MISDNNPLICSDNHLHRADIRMIWDDNYLQKVRQAKDFGRHAVILSDNSLLSAANL